jgi:transposase-like protein
MDRKEYTPEYKARIAIEILEGERTLAEIATREGVSSRCLSNWRNEFLANASRAFSVSRDEKEARRTQREAEEREKVLAEKVGQLTVELDWLKKKSAQVGLPTEKRHDRR